MQADGREDGHADDPRVLPRQDDTNADYQNHGHGQVHDREVRQQFGSRAAELASQMQRHKAAQYRGQQQGREGLKQVIGAFRTAFPDIHWVIEEMIGEGEKVFSRFTWEGTHRGEFFGVPATGKQIKVKGMVVDRVVTGKMVESRILMDGLSMMRQLGVIPE